MKVDAVLHGKDLRGVAGEARAAESLGHDAVWVTEEGTDPFLHAFGAVEGTDTCTLGTAVAVAFARSPMVVAQAAWQLAGASQGRFVLGLGSQVKAHIERRYSMPWHRPIDQMRDYLTALQAIWHSWRTGEALDHHGPYYEHSLMAPLWVPQAHEAPLPVFLAAVGPRMVELAGEMCDGVMLHPFSNRAYEDSVVRKSLESGTAAAGKRLGDVEVSRSLFMVMGDTDQELEERRRDACAKLAFYASTKAYRPVLEAAGLGDLQPELAALARTNEWDRMAELVDADAFAQFAVIGSPEQMPDLARAHLSDLVTRVSSYLGWPVDDPDRLREILARFRGAAGNPSKEQT